MTAIVRDTEVKAHPLARAGYVVPGLGHLLTGDVLGALPLLAADVVLAWSAIAGFPRIGAVVFSAHHGSFAWHGLVAILAWVALAAGAWRFAWRRANPRPYDPDQFNGNNAIFLRQFRRSKTGMIGLVGVVFMIAVTLVAPLIAPFDPDAVDAGPANLGPSFAYLMGTDNFGRDMFSRVLYGSRISLSIGFIAVAIAGTIGTAVGAVAAYAGGWLDRLLMWFVDLLLSLPRLILLLAIVGMFRPQGVAGLYMIIVVLGLTGWMSVSRIVRSQVLSLKQREFVQAAHALGYSDSRIVFRHLVPNALAPVIVYASLAIGFTILAEAGLSFLGLGVQPPTATWGSLVADGRDHLSVAPWIATFPGLCIAIAVMSFNLVGDGLRDALDPSLRGE
jgi:peptide/nickel transport system permease protein